MKDEYFEACFINNIEEISNLLRKYKELINATLLNEENGLHIASSCNYIDLAQLLINNKININKKDIFGRTPLMIACKKGNIKIVENLLSQKNIYVNEEDNGGNTAAILGIFK